MVPLTAFESIQEKTWVLTYTLLKQKQYPLTPLADCFQGAMQALEDQCKCVFSSTIKERVWQSIGPAKLTEVNESLAYTLAETVAQGFKEKEIDEMLLLIQGEACSHENSHRFKFDCLLRDHQGLLQKKTLEKVHAIAKSWKTELLGALQKEGIQLPFS